MYTKHQRDKDFHKMEKIALASMEKMQGKRLIPSAEDAINYFRHEANYYKKCCKEYEEVLGIIEYIALGKSDCVKEKLKERKNSLLGLTNPLFVVSKLMEKGGKVNYFAIVIDISQKPDGVKLGRIPVKCFNALLHRCPLSKEIGYLQGLNVKPDKLNVEHVVYCGKGEYYYMEIWDLKKCFPNLRRKDEKLGANFVIYAPD